jgi:hypothetical protein
MKNMKSEQTEEIFNEFTLTTEEMICVKGGDAGDPILRPPLLVKFEHIIKLFCLRRQVE